MKFDYLIVGLGVSGTFLSFYLQQQGAAVCVMDEERADAASMVAAGLINPVTGRRMVKSWMIDELLPAVRRSYVEIGNSLLVNSFTQTRMLHFIQSPDMQDAFNKKLLDDAGYLSRPEEDFRQYFNYPFGVAAIAPCYIAHIKELVTAWRQRLSRKGHIINERFDAAQLHIAQNHIRYKDIHASKIIFCEGAAGYHNPWFTRLPWTLNKGEALLVHIPGLPANDIYKFGHSLIPVYPQASVFWYGSNYERDFTDAHPTEPFRANGEAALKHILKMPFTIEGHIAAIRAGNIERRPFVGVHPAYPQLGILNGMGSKGCSLAPYFARQFANYLSGSGAITKEVDVGRFGRILS